ncbi:hypothetical protein SALCHL_006440 [Streptomyces albus subsp. chlorinus]|uniref:hypothetical protein n=1 Tax=Streptomyces albus TaxID=1888 RepID=UPI001570047E|nr:hypothetical protein [Streptomyces albus]
MAFTSMPYDTTRRTHHERSSALHAPCEGRGPLRDQDALITAFVEKHGDGPMRGEERAG